MRRRQGRKNKTIGQTSFQREQEVAPKLMDLFEAELERRRNSPRASEASKSYISQFTSRNFAQNLWLYTMQFWTDALYSNRNLIIGAEHLERQLRRVGQEYNAMEAKYEVCSCLVLHCCS